MKLKKILSGLFLIGSVLGCTSCNSDLLVVYTEVGFAPFEYIKKGEIVGVDIDIMEKVGQKLGKKVIFENISFDIIVDVVGEGKITNIGAAGLSITEERLQKVDFSIPYYQANLYVIYDINNINSSFYKTMSDGHQGVYWSSLYTNKGIGIQSGTTADLFLSDELVEDGSLYGVKKSDYDLLDTAIEDIGLNIDYVIVDELPARKLVQNKSHLSCLPLYYEGESSDELAFDEYAIAVTKNHPELLNAINEVLKELLIEDEDGLNSIQKMVNIHLGI